MGRRGITDRFAASTSVVKVATRAVKATRRAEHFPRRAIAGPRPKRRETRRRNGRGTYNLLAYRRRNSSRSHHNKPSDTSYAGVDTSYRPCWPYGRTITRDSNRGASRTGGSKASGVLIRRRHDEGGRREERNELSITSASHYGNLQS
jgi:hypothetical protein